MKRKQIIIIGLLLVIFVGWFAFYLYNKPTQSLENVKVDYGLSADELFNAFEADEGAASLRYIDKVIEVTGLVEDVSATDTTGNIILVAENAMIGGVNCEMAKEVDISQVQEGSELTLKCSCQGYLMNVILNNCVISKP